MMELSLRCKVLMHGAGGQTLWWNHSTSLIGVCACQFWGSCFEEFHNIFWNVAFLAANKKMFPSNYMKAWIFSHKFYHMGRRSNSSMKSLYPINWCIRLPILRFLFWGVSQYILKRCFSCCQQKMFPSNYMRASILSQKFYHMGRRSNSSMKSQYPINWCICLPILRFKFWGVSQYFLKGCFSCCQQKKMLASNIPQSDILDCYTKA